MALEKVCRSIQPWPLQLMTEQIRDVIRANPGEENAEMDSADVDQGRPLFRGSGLAMSILPQPQDGQVWEGACGGWIDQRECRFCQCL